MLRALIVDDERGPRESLRLMLTQFCEGVDVIAAVADVQSAITAIAAQRPHVMFLDIEMPQYGGFTLAEKPEFGDIATVFVTAHAEHALRAFRAEAYDYLLKPVSVDQLRESLTRVRQRVGPLPTAPVPRLSVFAGGRTLVYPLADVVYLEADGSYTHVVTTDDRQLVSRRLGELSEGLEASGFYRSHRSYLVNLRHVREVHPFAELSCAVSTGETIPLSRSRRAGMMEALGA